MHIHLEDILTQPSRLRGTLIADRNLAAEIEIGPTLADLPWLRQHFSELQGALVYSVPQLFSDLVVWPDPEKFSCPVNLGQIISVATCVARDRFEVKTHLLDTAPAFERLVVKIAPGVNTPPRIW